MLIHSFKIRPPGTNQYPCAGRFRRFPSKIFPSLLSTIRSIETNGVDSMTVLKVSKGSIFSNTE